MYQVIDRVYRLLRPIIFGLTDPEWAHELACEQIRRLERCLLVGLIEHLGGYAEYREELGQTIGGVYFPNPVGLAAGFDKTGELAHLLHFFGFGSIEVGTFTLRPRDGNPRPRLERLLKMHALINRMGWNNPGAERGRSNLFGKVRTVPIGVNIGPMPDLEDADLAIKSVVSAVELLGPLADYLAINPSCSNVRIVDFQDPFLLVDLVNELRARLPWIADKLTLVKLKPDTTADQLAGIYPVCVCRRIGLILGNTFGMSRGALSGPRLYRGIPGQIESLPNRISHAYQATGGLVPIVACGGIETGAQAYEVIQRGASLVQGLTGWVYGGPFWPREVCEELARLTRREGLSNISALRGTYPGR